MWVKSGINLGNVGRRMVAGSAFLPARNRLNEMKKLSDPSTKFLTLLLAAASAIAFRAAADSLTVHVDQPGITFSPTFYGLMTEEINHSYDGGFTPSWCATGSLRMTSATRPTGRW